MSLRRLPLLAALAVGYVAAGRFGLSMALVNESASAIWPPTGLALAACLLGGAGLWPAVLAGAFVVNVSTTHAVVPSLLIACGNTAEIVIATLLIGRFARGRALLSRTSDILMFLAAVALAAAVAATFGVAALLLGNLAARAEAAGIWLTWWTGDLSSAVLLTPLVVTWAASRPSGWTGRRLAEALVQLGVILVAAYWVFGPSPAGVRSFPITFVILPVLLWSTLRFGTRGAASAVFATSVVAISGTLAGLGPFARGGPNESLLLLQAYLLVKMIVMLSLAAEVGGRLAVEQDIRQLNADLERRIAARSEDLQRLHGRLVEAQAVAHIGSWEWDIPTNSVWWSDEMYRVYGVPAGTSISYDRYVSLIHPDDRDRVQEVIRKAAETGEPFTFEHRAVQPDGSVRVLHSRGRIVLDAQGKAIRMLGIGHDITDRKRAEEERLELVREQAARIEAEEASRMKDYFLATLSHELRTPLNALLGWAQLLKKSDLDDSLRHKAMEAIERNVYIQAQLVSDILDVARIRSGTLSIERHPTPVRTIVDGALDIMRPVIVQKEIEVTVDVPDDATVLGDGQRLQQVLWNMVSNAAKFVPAAGHIFISSRVDGDDIEIAVEDDGPGIREDFLPHVFEQFRQADASVTRSHGGLGLGLTISRHLVQLHGGTITAVNRAAGGARFVVRLPAALPGGAPAPG